MTDVQTEVTQIHDANMLLGVLTRKVRATLPPGTDSGAQVLGWLSKQDPAVISAAILGTQPKGWDGSAAQLVESLTPDQRVGMLAALSAIMVQFL